MVYNICEDSILAVKLLKLAEKYTEKMSEYQQVLELVELVTKQIPEYKDKGKLAFLERLKDFCIKHNLTVEIAKMYRNIGMYHFYTNDFDKAIISLQLAVDILRRERFSPLLIEYYSELGLAYFYNRDYIYAKIYYKEAEELILTTPDLDNKLICLHYGRFGALLSNMHDYSNARQKLDKALLFAEDAEDEGLIIMNIGLLYKRQEELKSALRYYSRALFILGDKNNKTKGIVYNNIAEVYKLLGQYEKALSYIDKAFRSISDNDISRMFVYFNTYTEIKILMGEREAVLDEFLELLTRVKDLHLYRGLIIEGISNMAVIGSEDGKLLKKLEAAVIKLIEENTWGNDEYVKELKVCLGNIRLCMKELKN